MYHPVLRMKNPRLLLLSMLLSGIGLAPPVAAEAHCLYHCRPHGWILNRWGYAGLVQGGWGVGGSADAPWVGGSIIGVESYGPGPYGLYPPAWRPLHW